MGVMCQVGVAEKDVVRCSYDGCHILAQSSWEVVRCSYYGCHV